MAGSFLALDGAEGFLPDSEGGAGLHEGRFRVGPRHPRRAGRQGSAADRASGAWTRSSPARGPGALLELARRHPDAPVLVDDSALAARLKPALGDRVVVVARAFDDDIEEQVEALAQPDVEPARRRPAAHPSYAGAGGDRRRRAAARWQRGRARRRRIWRRIRRCCRRWRGRSGCATCPARSWWTSPDCRRAGAPRLRRPCTPRWRRTRCGHGCSASPHWAWRRSSGRACIRRCTSCWLVRMPRGWRRCVGLRPRLTAPPHRMPVLRASPAIVAALQGDAEALPDLARRAGRALILRSDPTPAGNGVDARDERWLSADDRRHRVRSAASPRLTSCARSAAGGARMSTWAAG